MIFIQITFSTMASIMITTKISVNNEKFSSSLRKLEDGKNVIYHTSMV